MWPTLFLGLLVVSVAGWGITAYLQKRRIRRLERSHEEIQVEETLVFDFLHGLGEAFRETIRPQELHRSWRGRCASWMHMAAHCM